MQALTLMLGLLMATATVEQPQTVLHDSPLVRAVFESTADELVILSGRGPGKSHALYAREMFRAAHWPNYRWTFYRSNYTDIKEHVTPLLNWSNDWLGGVADVTSGTNRVRVSNKATGSYGVGLAAETAEQVTHHQGGNYHTIVRDEVTLIQPDVNEAMGAVIRGRADEYKWQDVFLGNPFGPSHVKIRERYVTPALEADPNGNVKHPDYYDKDLNREVWTNPISGITFVLNDMTGHIVENGKLVENREYRNGHWMLTLSREIDGEQITRTVEVILPSIHFNPAMDTIAYVNSLKWQYKDNPIKRDGWIYNDWSVISGEAFPNVGQAVRKNLRAEITEFDRILCAIDHGHRKTAVGWAAVDKDGVYRFFECKMYHRTDISAKVPQILNVNRDVELYIIDPAASQVLEGSGSRTIRRLYSNAGLNPLVYCKSNNRHFGWEACRTGFTDGTILIDEDYCKPVIDSFASLKVKDTDIEDCEKTDGTELQDDGDHFADMLRYMIVNGFYTGRVEEDYVTRETKKAIAADPYLAEALAKANHGDLRFDGLR